MGVGRPKSLMEKNCGREIEIDRDGEAKKERFIDRDREIKEKLC